MKFAVIVMVLGLSNAASAGDYGFVDAATLQRAQLEVLKSSLKTELGLTGDVEFKSELLSPMKSYNDVSDLTASVNNLWKTKDRRVYGAGARQVKILLGPVGYDCQALIEFVGGLNAENVKYVGLNGCRPFFTQEAGIIDDHCAAAATRDPATKAEACKPFSVLPPSALAFEVRH